MLATRRPLSPEPFVPMCPVRTYAAVEQTDCEPYFSPGFRAGYTQGPRSALKTPYRHRFSSRPSQGGYCRRCCFHLRLQNSIPVFLEIPITLQSKNPGRRTGLSCQRNKRYSYMKNRHPLTVDSAIHVPSCSLQLSVVRNRTGCFIGDYLHGYYPDPPAFILLPFLSTPGQHQYSVVFRYSAGRKSVTIPPHPRPAA